MLGDQERRPGLGQRPERLADEPRPGRVELGGRLVEDHVARPHRQQRRDPDELGLAAGEPLRVALDRGARAAAGRSPRASARRSRRPRRPRFIGPSAISSKTVAAIPERWVFGFWKPTTTRSASSCVVRPAVGSPSIVSVPVRLAADRRRREPGRDEAERGLARLVRPDEADDLAVVEPQVDRRGGPRSRSPA